MREKGKDFDKFFIEAVDEGLNSLGEGGRQMIFFHLENSYSIKKHDIPKKPETFAAALEEIFGEGALILEKLIAKSLYSKLGLDYEERSDCTFRNYVTEARKQTEVVRQT